MDTTEHNNSKLKTWHKQTSHLFNFDLFTQGLSVHLFLSDGRRSPFVPRRYHLRLRVRRSCQRRDLRSCRLFLPNAAEHVAVQLLPGINVIKKFFATDDGTI